MEQLTEFNKIIDDLANIDVNLEDEDKALHLLCALPRSFENFKNKSHAFGKFKEWHTLVENQIGTKLKVLRTDNRLEFV